MKDTTGFHWERWIAISKLLQLKYVTGVERRFLCRKRNFETIAIARDLIIHFQQGPFVDFNNQTGKYEGFCVDLIDLLADRRNFTYELYESPDGSYGAMTENGTWTGMIQELILGVSIEDYSCFTHCIKFVDLLAESLRNIVFG